MIVTYTGKSKDSLLSFRLIYPIPHGTSDKKDKLNDEL